MWKLVGFYLMFLSFILNFAGSVVIAWCLEVKERDAKKRGDNNIVSDCKRKRRQLQKNYHKRHKILLCATKLICFGASACAILFFVVCVVASNNSWQGVSTEPESENSETVILEEMFVQDEAIMPDVPLDGDMLKDYQYMLHWEWMLDPDLKSYGRKITGIYEKIPTQKDVPFLQLELADQEKVKKYAEEIREIQKKKETAGLAEEESSRESELYIASFQIHHKAELLYQAARAAEDAFWSCNNSGNADYGTLLKYAAKSIACFELYVEYENHEVLVGDQEKIVQIEELMYRNGKLYWILACRASDLKEKSHFLRCAYSCFANITVDGFEYTDILNQWSLMGYYYLGLVISNMLENMDKQEEGYTALWNEGYKAYENICKLYDETTTIAIENGNNIENGRGIYLIEQDMQEKIKGLHEKLLRYRQWASSL